MAQSARPTEVVEFIKDSGACLVSNRVLSGQGRVRFMYRSTSQGPADNGWRIFSEFDDASFTADLVNNFSIISFNEICTIEPTLVGIYDFPVGADLVLERPAEGPISIVDATTGQQIPTEALYVPEQHRD